MYELLMFVFGIVLCILFVFLSAINLIILFSFFVRPKQVFFKPNVSIVVPVYNEEKNIKSCLESIFASDYQRKKIEVIIVDDGCTDNTVAIAKEFKSVIIIKNHHNGKADALSKGIMQAKNEFIITLDADTIIEKNCIKTIVMHMHEPDVGAVCGFTKVRNKNSFLCWFQNIEYAYNNLVREGFSRLFKYSIWFHGATSCYRASAIKKAGYLKSDTLSEDLDVSFKMCKYGFRTVNAGYAFSKTFVPENLTGFILQRTRWYAGVFQCLKKHKSLFNLKSYFSVLFIFINQFWWLFFAIISFPMFLLQILYWFPQATSFANVALYFFRWFSLAGPVYVVYNLPVWGFSIYNFFGVMSGIITSLFLFISWFVSKDTAFLKVFFAVFFYFPYTILINFCFVISIFRYKFYKESFFIR